MIGRIKTPAFAGVQSQEALLPVRFKRATSRPHEVEVIMKRESVFLVIALLAIMTLVLVGCSGKKESPTSSQASQSAPVAEQGTTASSRIDTVARFLTQINLTEADIKPEGAGEGQIFDISSSGNRASITWNMGEATAEQENTWLKKVYDATKALSTDGKVYVDGTDMKDEFIFAPLNRAEWESDMTWVYPYNENEIGVRCQILGNGAVDLRIIII